MENSPRPLKRLLVKARCSAPEELSRHGRAGVPLVLLFPKDTTAAPIVLPEVLTPGIVLTALDRAAN